MNDLGLGVVVSMKDAFSRNAMRIEYSMQSLHASVAAASERMTLNLDRMWGYGFFSAHSAFSAATVLSTNC